MKTPPPRTKEESADLIRRLDDLVSQSDTSQVVNIQQFQNEHLLYMGKEYGRFMNQFEMFFCAMVDYSHTINYLDKKEWPINRGFQFVIATNSLRQMYSAYILLNSGFYEDAITLLRSVYESFLRILFVSCHPECPYNAYDAPGQTGTKFNATSFVRDELKLDWTKYNITSAFAHSNKYKVMGDMIELAKQPKLIALTYEKDDDMISLGVNLIGFLLAFYLKAFDELFTVDISKHQQKDVLQKLLDKIHEYAKIEHESLKGHDANEYWRQVGADIEDIFELMLSMDTDSSQKWKVVWNEIRKRREA